MFSCRSSLPCLVPNADRTLAAATYPILGWDGPHRAPAPRMLRDVVWMYVRPSRSQPVSARKLCSGDALRPDPSWVPNKQNRTVHGSQCALLGPLAVRRTTPLYRERRPHFLLSSDFALYSLSEWVHCWLVSLAAIIFGQHPVQRGVSRTMCQCACWWWLTCPKRVCQWNLSSSYFLLEVLHPSLD